MNKNFDSAYHMFIWSMKHLWVFYVDVVRLQLKLELKRGFVVFSWALLAVLKTQTTPRAAV